MRGRNRVSNAPGAFRGAEDSTWSAKRPVFASQNPRFSDHVMERRGWNSRFPVKFGTGFACRGEDGFNAEACPESSRQVGTGIERDAEHAAGGLGKDSSKFQVQSFK